MKTYHEMSKREKEKYKVDYFGQSIVYLNSAEVRVNTYFENKFGQLKTEGDIATLFDMSLTKFQTLRISCEDEIVRDFLDHILVRLQKDLLELTASGRIKQGVAIYKQLYPDKPKEVEEQTTKVDF